MKSYSIYSLILFTLLFCLNAEAKTYDLRKYGVIPNTEKDMTQLLSEALKKITAENDGTAPIVVKFQKGSYHFYPAEAAVREYYISNHDQVNPKKVGIVVENLKNIVLDGQGSAFVFYGRMLPLSIMGCEGCIFKNFSIDFAIPHIIQFKITANDTENGKITCEVASWVKYKIENGKFIAYGEDWQHTPQSCIAFDGEKRNLVYNTSDLGVNFNQVTEIAPRTIVAENWKQPKLTPGTVIAGRSWYRPAPGILLDHSNNTRFENIKIHYAEGMGLLAQLCENITLDGFSVCLKGKNDPRYFTTQADATHFSGCKGKITSINGLYEGMMDDAINIHGTYLKIMNRIDDKTFIAGYMHSQSYGFEWGRSGDAVQFIKSSTMELAGTANTVAAIAPLDRPEVKGAKLFKIEFTQPVAAEISEKEGFGIENLEWTPEVLFAHNTIRNNRARGSLFSTPKKTVVENNIFDHTSGTAILLCGDCNGWYETGACRDVLIRKNTFINALTNMFQFTNAVISIYPEIPDLGKQEKYFHGGRDVPGIVIEDNRFITFDRPLLYAKSISGLVFRNNTVINNQDFPAFHWNKHLFFFEKAENIRIMDNKFPETLDFKRDIRLNLTPEKEIHTK